MRRLFDARLHRLGAFPCRIEVVDYEPKKKALPNTSVFWIGERRMAMVTPMMDAHQDSSVSVENLIEDSRARMIVFAVQ